MVFQITPTTPSTQINPGDKFTVSVNFDQPAGENLIDLSLNIFYKNTELNLIDSSITFPGISGLISPNRSDSEGTNIDNDPETNIFLTTVWSPNIAGLSFTPPTLMTLEFEALSDFDGTNINLTANGNGNTEVNADNLEMTLGSTPPINQKPNFNSPSTFDIDENQTIVGTVSATDPDNDTLSYSISGGADQSLFNLNSSTGALTFKTAPSVDSDTVYQVEVEASDDQLTDTQNLTVNVQNIDTSPPPEPPSFNSPSSFNIDENQTTVGTVSATDPDNDTLIYSISGGADQSLFNLNSSTGALSFKTAPSVDSDTAYQVEVEVSDGQLTDTQNLTINVQNIDTTPPPEPPNFNSPSSFNVDENETFVGSILAEDPNGDNVTYFLSGGANQSLFNVSTSGVLDFNNPPDVNSDTQYQVQVSASDGQFTTTQDIIVNVKNVEDKFDTPLNRFQNSSVPGTYLYASEEESIGIRTNFPNFIEEGYAFTVASQPGDDLIRINRFQNLNVPGTYLFAGEEESVGIRTNFPNFIEEGIAFYVYDSDENIATDFFRFQNTNRPGTYLIVGEAEADNILAGFPEFNFEGVAFEVVV